MNAKKLVQDFYKSDAIINCEILKDFLHPEVILEWNSSKGFIKMNYQELMILTEKMSKAYIDSKIKIKHLVKQGNMVSVNYSHFIKTFENPKEEMLLAYFFAIWEVKDEKLYKCYQMSQLS